MIPIGERLKQLRTSKGWTQNDLAAALKITQGALSEIENSPYPPLSRLYQICEILNEKPWKVLVDDPKEMKDFMPDWVTEKDLELIYAIHTRLSPRQKKLFYDAIEGFMNATLIDPSTRHQKVKQTQ